MNFHRSTIMWDSAWNADEYRINQNNAEALEPGKMFHKNDFCQAQQP